MRLASDARSIARAALRAVDPARALRASVRRKGRTLWVGTHPLRPGPGGQWIVIALGKAAGALSDAAIQRIGPGVGGIAAVPRGYPGPQGSIQVAWGDHPIPKDGSFRAGRAVRDVARSTRPADRVLFLISGGGSATAELPIAGVRPEELSRMTAVLLESGAPIGAMNAIRRHLSQLKGGRLAAETGADRFATLVLSDVIGDAPEDIASGPTVADPSRFSDACHAVRKYRLGRRLPAAVLRVLSEGRRGRSPETVKPGDPRVARGVYHYLATNRTAVEAAAGAARRRGYRTTVIGRPIVGETRAAGAAFARRLVRARPAGRPLALIGGGETTVTLGPHPGRGGRNQEFALAAARPIASQSAVVLSIGTDGIDGPTDAAGGWVDGSTWDRSVRRGCPIGPALARHASYDCLATLGTLWRTGPTGTNVTDVHVGLSGRPKRRR